MAVDAHERDSAGDDDTDIDGILSVARADGDSKEAVPECDGVCSSLPLGVGVRLTDLVPNKLLDVDEERLGEPEFEGDPESDTVYSSEEGLADELGDAVEDRETALERDAEGVRVDVVVGVIVVVEDEELEYEATLDDALGEGVSEKL